MENIVLETNTDSERKLASIQIVETVEKHNNANALEVVGVLGWQIVTRTSETKPGDLVVLIEIDSILPYALWLPPAIKQKIEETKKETFRLKTAKLRGELSQGLIVPLVDSMPAEMCVSKITRDDIGRDVTKILGITKYEPPALSGAYASAGTPRVKTFPSHIISKTDETRIQSSPKYLKLLNGKPYYATVKCDGTSCTFFMGPSSLNNVNDNKDVIKASNGDDDDDSESDAECDCVLIVCSRNQICPRPAKLETSPYWRVAEKYKLQDKLSKMPHLAIQCEICGPDVQSNMLGLKDLELFVFNVVDIREPGGRKIPFTEMLDVCKKLGLPTVPIEEVGESFGYVTPAEVLVKAEGQYPKSKKQREGLVFRSQDQEISFKAINNKYLLKIGQ